MKKITPGRPRGSYLVKNITQLRLNKSSSTTLDGSVFNHFKVAPLKYETDLWAKGFDYIIGVDEVGRGCLAGPIVAGAVVWKKENLLRLLADEKNLIHKVRDSKKTTEKSRNILSELIKTEALYFCTHEISANEIDEKGIQWANKNVMVRAVKKIKEEILRCAQDDGGNIIVLTDYLDISAELNPLGIKMLPILHGDSESISISSASIVAKVYRDTLMKTDIHEKYPHYGFDKHVGYGTKFHMDKIREHGMCEEHRRTFVHV